MRPKICPIETDEEPQVPVKVDPLILYFSLLEYTVEKIQDSSAVPPVRAG